MTKKEQAKVVREIADEIEAKGWYNPRKRHFAGVCPLACSATGEMLGADINALLGLAGWADTWNDSHDNVESLLADLRARADFLDAAPEEDGQ